MLISLISSPFFSLNHDDEKRELTNIWNVAYTPYCGGLHLLTIDVGDESTVQVPVTVSGIPTVGSQVMKGPNGRGTIEGEVVSYKESSQKITVKASMWNGYRMRNFAGGLTLNEAAWGKSDRYEIQIKH